MATQQSQTSNSRLAHSLFVALVSIVGTGIVGYIGTTAYQNRASVKAEAETRSAQVQEIHQLLERMERELNLGSYDKFREDAITFQEVVGDHRYDQALGIDYTYSDLRLLFDSASDELTLYLFSCKPDRSSQIWGDFTNCSRMLDSYISPPLKSLSLALQSRKPATP
jgi:hypothetical protein